MSCKKGPNWSDEETKTFLELCTERKILTLMDGKKHKHLEIFRSLVNGMEERGFFKTAEQMKLKLKNLRLAYYKCKDEKNGSTKNKCIFYEELNTLFSARSNAQLDASAFNSGESNENRRLRTEYIIDANNSDKNRSSTDDQTESEKSFSEIHRKKRKRTADFSERKSYESELNSYTEKLLTSQNKLLKDIIIQQNEMQKNLLKNEMEKQRKWELEMLEKEHEFQKKQMDSFLETMVALLKEDKI